MLMSLSIRDVVLIERLDLAFDQGLTVLTGETGAGKSILLDSLGLALGARAESGLVRATADQASVTACFASPDSPTLLAVLEEYGLGTEDEVVLRRTVNKDGRSRAFVNDNPVGVGLLRRIGEFLVEVQGQHEQMSLADPSRHLGLLDAFGIPSAMRRRTAEAWRSWQDALSTLKKAREAIAEAERDEEWLRHAVDELATLAPRVGEEESLSKERLRLQQNERRAEAIASALAELTPRDRRSGRDLPPPCAPPWRARCNAWRHRASRKHPIPPNRPWPRWNVPRKRWPRPKPCWPASSPTPTSIRACSNNPRNACSPSAPPPASTASPSSTCRALLDTLTTRLAALETGAAAITALEQAVRDTRSQYDAAAEALSAARTAAAATLQQAVTAELPPLRLDKARFFVEVTLLPEVAWGSTGIDQVRFLIATNPGQEPGPLARVASGGELSRLMLAMKVVLSAGSAVPTLVFDEVDSGIGGATAAAVGERLARVAEQLQVLVVTHSPQVAARGAAHLRVAKAAALNRTATTVDHLDPSARREEIARMLAGETISDAARAAADDLLSTPKPAQGLLV